MTCYYNEINKHAAQWLCNLIAAGVIPDGVVDTRSIEDVHPTDLRDFDQCHFFAGIGGWPLALRLAGVPDNRPVWTGSCPCQPFSAAGQGLGFADERHLWPHFFHLISEHRKWCEKQERQVPIVFGEQVASKSGLEWIDLVQVDLEGAGYAFGKADLCAAGVGAEHVRQRLYWVADPEWDEQPRQESCGWAAGRVGGQQQPFPWNGGWEAALARFRAMGDGVPRCVAGTDAARNAIVPQVAQAFIEAVMECQP